MAHCSSKFDEVSRNAVLTECIKREQKAQKLNQVFTVSDPRKVRIIADKPNYSTPAMQPTEQQLQEAHETLSTLSNVKHIEQTPNQVFELPITGNMEYGFFAKPLVHQDPMFQHNKGTCDVTQYAAAYTALKGTTPFHSPSGAAAATKKK